MFNANNSKQKATIMIERVTVKGNFAIPGAKNTTITIESDASNGPQMLSLSGTGVKAQR